MYKSNLDPGEGNAKDGVRRTPSFLNMYVPGFSEKSCKRVSKMISLTNISYIKITNGGERCFWK